MKESQVENGAALPVMAAWAPVQSPPVNLQMATYFSRLAKAWQPSVAAVSESRDYTCSTVLSDLVATQRLIRQDLEGLQVLTVENWSPGAATIAVTLPTPMTATASRDVSWPSFTNLIALASDAVTTARDGWFSYDPAGFYRYDWRGQADDIRVQPELGNPHTPSWWPWRGQESAARFESVHRPEVAGGQLLLPDYVSYVLSELDAKLRISSLKRLLNYVWYLTSVVIRARAYVVRLRGAVDSVMAIIHTFMAHRHSREPADGLLLISTSTVRPWRVAIIG